MSKITIEGDNGVTQVFDGSEVMIINLQYRTMEIVALEEIMRVLKNLNGAESARVLAFASDAVKDRK